MIKKYFSASTLYFCFYFVFVTTSFFTAPYVTDTTGNQTITGYAFNGSLGLAIFLMLTISYLQDKQLVKAKSIMASGIAIIMMTYVFMIFCTSFSLYFLFFLNSSLVYALPAFLDSYTLNKIAEKKYSLIRSFGSFGAAISYFISAFIIGELTFVYIAFINIILLAIMLFLVLMQESPISKHKTDYKTGLIALSKNKPIIYIFILAFLSYGVIRADDPFTFKFNTDYTNLTAATIGITGLFSIFFEGSIMMSYNRMLAHWSRHLLLNAALASLLIIFITKYLFYDIKLIIILGNILLGLYVGLFIPTIIHMISSFTTANIQTSLLSIYQIAILIGGICIGLPTTYIYSITGFLPDIYLLHILIVCLAIPLTHLLKKLD